MKTNNFQIASVIVAAAVLSACGGGGGGTTNAGATLAPPNTITPAVITPTFLAANIDSTIYTANYAAGSEEASAFTLLNAERVRCGFGSLKQNTKLDDAAYGHVYWKQINGYTGHYQTA